jgi:hypothetical protein
VGEDGAHLWRRQCLQPRIHRSSRPPRNPRYPSATPQALVVLAGVNARRFSARPAWAHRAWVRNASARRASARR